MKAALIPQMFYLAGCLCFIVGTSISIWQTVHAREPANINCGDGQ